MSRRRRKRTIGVFLVSGLVAAGAFSFGLPMAGLGLPLQTRTSSGPSASTPPPTASTPTPEPASTPEIIPTPTEEAEDDSSDRAAPLAAPAPAVVNYIVRSGDTLLALADRYDTTIEKLLRINPGTDPARIRAGQLLKVPDKMAEEGLVRPRFIWPADGPITTPFNEPGSSWIGGFHPGLDIGASTGDFIWSAEDGVIAATSTDGMGRGYGTYVLIYHFDGWSTLYAHLSKVYRPAGYLVRRGEPIGEVGMTGFADGPHLHFEVWHDGERQDPIAFLP